MEISSFTVIIFAEIFSYWNYYSAWAETTFHQLEADPIVEEIFWRQTLLEEKTHIEKFNCAGDILGKSLPQVKFRLIVVYRFSHQPADNLTTKVETLPAQS